MNPAKPSQTRPQTPISSIMPNLSHNLPLFRHIFFCNLGSPSARRRLRLASAAGGPDAYVRSLAALREDTRGYWQECLDDDAPDDGLTYAATAEALKAWIGHHWTEWYEQPIAELQHRGAIRDQALSVAYAAQALDVAAPRHDVGGRERQAHQHRPQVAHPRSGNRLRSAIAFGWQGRPAYPTTAACAQQRVRHPVLQCTTIPPSRRLMRGTGLLWSWVTEGRQ